MKDKIEVQDGSTPYFIDDDQRAVVDFTLGRRLPTNQYERDLYQEIQEMIAKGIIIEMPFE